MTLTLIKHDKEITRVSNSLQSETKEKLNYNKGVILLKESPKAEFLVVAIDEEDDFNLFIKE